MSKFARDFAKLTIKADDENWNSNPIHGPIKQLFRDIWFVRGRMPATPSRPNTEKYFVYYSRTMTIIKIPQTKDEEKNHLVLINTVKLNKDGLRQLDQVNN
jgi:hypothetical protein